MGETETKDVAQVPAIRRESLPEITWSPEEVQLLRDMVAPDATDNELRYFFAVCQQTGLNPFLRQIYFIKRWNKAAGKKVGTVQTGIDGFRSTAEDSAEYAGQDSPKFEHNDQGALVSATVTIYRLVNGERVPFSHTAFWDEYVQLTKEGNPTEFWRRMPRNQLAKCAEAGAFRKGFPRRLSKIYVQEEMDQAANHQPVIESLQPDDDSTGPDEIPKPLRDMKSGIQKTTRCNFCGKTHIEPGHPIVLHPTMKTSKGKEAWGAAECYAATFGDRGEEPEKQGETIKQKADRMISEIMAGAEDGAKAQAQIDALKDQFLLVPVTGEKTMEIEAASPGTVRKFVDALTPWHKEITSA